MSPNLKYRNWTGLVNDSDVFIADNLARAIKFLEKIERRKPSAELRSLFRAYAMMSRVGHMLPRNQWGYYSTTFGPDIGQLMFHDHVPNNVIHEFQSRSASVFPSIENEGIPPTFIQHYTRNDKNRSVNLMKNKSWLHNYLAVNKFPTNHLLHPISVL